MFVVKISIKNSMEMIKDVKWHFILYKKDKDMLVSGEKACVVVLG